jgi:hypothetical protein
MEEFHTHITDQLSGDMTWENYGALWEIDHITPIMYRVDGRAPNLEELVERLHYTNTQPMLAYENRSKRSRYVGNYIPPTECKTTKSRGVIKKALKLCIDFQNGQI